MILRPVWSWVLSLSGLAGCNGPSENQVKHSQQPVLIARLLVRCEHSDGASPGWTRVQQAATRESCCPWCLCRRHTGATGLHTSYLDWYSCTAQYRARHGDIIISSCPDIVIIIIIVTSVTRNSYHPKWCYSLSISLEECHFISK